MSRQQLDAARELLTLHLSSPFIDDLSGRDWENVLAAVAGGERRITGCNRPWPDVYLPGPAGHPPVGVSVKTEAVRRGALRAWDLLGQSEDLIIARPAPESLFGPGERLETVSADILGARVIEAFNERVVGRYAWDRIAILLRLPGPQLSEFIYWTQPAQTYDPAQWWWRDSGRARPGNRNICAYRRTIDPDGPTRPAALRWTSGGKQLYIRYRIPPDADVFRVEHRLSSAEALEELRAAAHWRERALIAESAERELSDALGEMITLCDPR
ncbi:hypothetical protein [Miltoncostaea oceani]|uniref:hypothetical protein n=1 Tax=Miltoncostaea oceani TaxID=2843216 RepID=UPI001C3D23C4|nr:hypothetical protein [Miltoncostaea oceani]